MPENEIVTPEPIEPTKPSTQDFLSEKVSQLTGQIETLTGIVSQLQHREPTPAADTYVDPDDVGTIIDKRFKDLEEKQEKQRRADLWNQKTDLEFPDIVQRGEFYRLVVQEYNSSDSKDKPDGVYNAACRVYARTGKGKGIMPRNPGAANLAATTPGILPGQNLFGDELTPEEKLLAAKMEVSEDKFKKLRRKQ